MHRKSLEAAEALKDDSGGSDRDDEQSKASDITDISSPGNPSTTKLTPSSKSKKSNTSESLASPKTPTSSNPESGHNSVTPTTSSSLTSLAVSSPSSALSVSTANHTSLPGHHIMEAKSMLAGPPNPNYHHDSDSEAFRWVGDPISFIRCDISYFNENYSVFFLCRSSVNLLGIPISNAIYAVLWLHYD